MGLEAVWAMLLLPALVTLFAAAVLIVWAGHVERRHGALAVWKRARWLPVSAAVLVCCGLLTALVVWNRFSVREPSATPGFRAERLASALSESMNGAAMFFVLAWLLLVASAITSLVGTIRRVR